MGCNCADLTYYYYDHAVYRDEFITHETVVEYFTVDTRIVIVPGIVFHSLGSLFLRVKELSHTLNRYCKGETG